MASLRGRSGVQLWLCQFEFPVGCRGGDGERAVDERWKSGPKHPVFMEFFQCAEHCLCAYTYLVVPSPWRPDKGLFFLCMDGKTKVQKGKVPYPRPYRE